MIEIAMIGSGGCWVLRVGAEEAEHVYSFMGRDALLCADALGVVAAPYAEARRDASCQGRYVRLEARVRDR